MRYCQSCGQANQDDAQFCEKCGNSLAAAAQQPAAPGVQPPVAPAVDVSAIANQGKQALGGLVNRVGMAGIIAAVVGVVALVLVWTFFFKPMDASAYEDGIYDNWMEVQDGMSGVSESLSDYREYSSDDWDGSDKLDGEDWKETKADVKEQLKSVEKAAKKMKGMRAPGEYKSEGRRIDTYADWVLDDYVGGIESLMDGVKDGDRYEAVDREIGRAEEKSSESGNKAYRDLSRALEGLGIPWGE